MALKIVGIQTGKFGYARKAFSQRPFNTHQEVTDDEDLMPFWDWIGTLNRQFSNVSPAAPPTAPISFAVKDNLTCSGSMIRRRIRRSKRQGWTILVSRPDMQSLVTNEELHDQEPRSSTEIEPDIRKTRGRMDATLDELGDRLTARSLLNSALDWWESRSVSARSGGAAKDAYETVDLFPLSPNP